MHIYKAIMMQKKEHNMSSENYLQNILILFDQCGSMYTKEDLVCIEKHKWGGGLKIMQ